MKCIIKNDKYYAKKYGKNADKRLISIAENLDSMKIGADETFKFGCKMCGKCCTHRTDILLTPRDLFNIAKTLVLSPEEVIEKYCETYLGSSSRFPIVRLKPVGYNESCPLLNDRKCSVHNAKPAVCAMYPIGRYVIGNSEETTAGNLSTKSIGFIKQLTNCGDESETYTVREWLEGFGIPLEDEYFIEWQTFLGRISKSIREMEKREPTDVMDQMIQCIYIGTYLNYDTTQEFLPQFKENSEKIIYFVEAIEKEEN